MLFKTTIRLVAFAKLASTIDFKNVMPTIRMVEEQFLLPLLGEELYNDLDTAYTAAADDEAALTDVQKALLERCRYATAPLICYHYAPKADVIVSDAGVQRLETTTNKTAYQNQVVNYREQNLREHELATERLLQFLEDKKTDYPTWGTGGGFKEYRALFIKTGSEFQKLFPSHSPWRNYMAMRPRMVDVEENIIRPAIGDALFTELKTLDGGAQTFSDDQKKLLAIIKKIIAYETVALSVPFLNIRIDSGGITVQTGSAGTADEKITARGNASAGQLSSLIQGCTTAADSWRNRLTEVLAVIQPTEPFTLPQLNTGNNERKGAFGML